MEIEAIAGDFRRSLDETLRTVHKLTVGSESSAETVLCSMNDVLSEVVNSNFAAVESHASLARLYRVLEHAHTALLGECDNLPLLFFARSFAVVIEEAVRQLTDDGEEEEGEDTVSVPEGALVVEEEEEVEDEEEEEQEATVPLVGEETTAVEAAGEGDGDGFGAPIAVVEPLQPIVVDEKLQKASGDAVVADGDGAAVPDDVIVVAGGDVLGGGGGTETQLRPNEEDEQSWSSGGTPNESRLIMMEDSDWEEHAATRDAAGREGAEKPRERGASASASAESGWTDGTRASASLSATTQLSETTSTETTTTKDEEREETGSIDGVEQQQKQQMQPTGDYAAQATKGRITIYSIPACARKPDVQAFLRPIGPLRSLCLPTRQYDDKPLGYALAKFETNEEADAAVARLNGERLCGAPVAVRRAAFTVTYPDAAEFRPASAADAPPASRDHADAAASFEEQPPRFGTGQKELVREGAHALPRFRCNPDAPEFRPAAAPIPFTIRDHADAESDRFYVQQAAAWDEDGVWGSPERERAFVFPPVRDRAQRGCYPEARQKSCWDADGVWQEKW